MAHGRVMFQQCPLIWKLTLSKCVTTRSHLFSQAMAKDAGDCITLLIHRFQLRGLLNQSPKHQPLFILSSVLSHNQFTCWHRDRLDTRPFPSCVLLGNPPLSAGRGMFLGRTSPVIMRKCGLGSSGPALRVIHAEKVL